MAGLVTARVLADRFETVTLVEKDELPDDPDVRRGVPQGRHAHLLLEAGRTTLEDLFPGFGEDLVRAGGVVVDASTDLRHFTEGDFLADGPERIPLYSATRPLFEHVVRQRIEARERITVRPRCQFVEYRFDGAGTTVGGIALRDETGARAELGADLVVDATGRTSRTPALLERQGYSRPPVDEVRVDVAYSTVLVERPPDQREIVFVEADPPRRRGGVAFPVEDGRRLVTVFGLHGDRPPVDPDRLVDFTARFPVPDVKRFLDARPWVESEVERYPFPSNRRRRYEDVQRFPEGLLVVGDAVCSFNPIYGQGMTVAALEALVLHHVLSDGGREGLGPQFFDRAASVVDIAWNVAVGGDFEFPQTEGPKPRGTDFFNWYLSRLLRRAHTDGEMRDAFYRVLGMEEPPTSLLRPALAWRVLKPR
jgi:2-polyprenyl-6-methoxyphenol hydroxylase-like FAD-dependent oxidoreductase